MVTPSGVKPIRFGVWTPLPHTIPAEPRMAKAIEQLREGGGVGQPDPSFEFACDVVTTAEAAGFDITLIASRLLGPDLEAVTLASALAARTRTIELLVAAHPGIIPPQVLAKMAMSLDRISGGRCALNLVNGWFAQEFELFSNGAALDGDGDRYARMAEYVDVLCGMTSGGPFHHEGRFYRATLDTMPMRPARPHIPLYAASRAPDGKEVIARSCDLWFVDYEPDHRLYMQNADRIRRDVRDLEMRAARHDRHVDCGISCHVICAEDMDTAEASAQSLIQQGRSDRIAAIAAKGLGAGLVGTAPLIAERMLAYQESGVSCFMLHFHPMMEGLQRFISDVMPLVRAGADLRLTA